MGGFVKRGHRLGVVVFRSDYSAWKAKRMLCSLSFVKSFAGVPDLVAMINGFDTLFKADDDGDADEEVTPPSGGVVRWMDV
jgi:hypothetical protein